MRVVALGSPGVQRGALLRALERSLLRSRSRAMNVETATVRVRAEFEEMPGLALTVSQASRLFGIEVDVCRRVFDKLIGVSYLRETRAGAVARGDR